jgi:RHH-type proline utilization regulon transcriptional repressor/proline dehydrogenase/delta 1-pyrroline-5-carboxylate dehydrogenase
MQGQAKLVETEMQTMKSPLDLEKIETRTQEIGQQIFAMSRRGAFQVFNRNFWQNKFMELSMKDPRVKTQLFRFVDVLPVLKTSLQKREHLQEYIAAPRSSAAWPFLLRMTSMALHIPGLRNILMRISDRQVRQMGEMFIVGHTAEEALPRILELRKSKVGFTLDILGEAVLSDQESLHYQSQYEELIQKLGDAASQWPEIHPIDDSPLGPIPKVNVSVKVSAFDALTDPMAFESAIERLIRRLSPVLRLAMQKQIFINFDMEQFSLNALTRELFRRLILLPEFKNYRHFGVVSQAYLKSSEAEVDDWISLAEKRGTPFTIRLVKGAYWDYEMVVAQQNHWESPVFEKKWQSDQNFETCARKLLEAYPKIELAAGSHNVRSLSYCLAVAEALKLPQNAFEIQMLYGMAASFKSAFLAKGLRLREYCPMGEMLPGLSYLVRRLLENTANDSFLRQSFMDRAAIDQLLKKPEAPFKKESDDESRENIKSV